MIDFFVEGRPVTKGNIRQVYQGGKVVRFTADKGLKPWTTNIQWQAKQAMRGEELYEGPVCVDLRFYLARGKTVKRPYPCVIPDIDKLVRTILDALAKICYKDDGQVCTLLASKLYADNTPEGVHIKVYRDD